jgi:hypothetical protein
MQSLLQYTVTAGKCTTFVIFTVYRCNNLTSHANGSYINYDLTWLDGYRRQLFVTVVFTPF